MWTRILVGLVALPLVLIPLWLGGVWTVAVCLLIALLSGYEFYQMMRIDGYRPNVWLGLIWLAALVLNGWQPDWFPFSLVLIAGLIVTLIDALRRPEQPTASWMSTSIGAIYLGVAIGQWLAMRQLPNGIWWLLTGLVITWANDSAAYFTGVTVGRHRLWPRLSPKKTWEGTIAGWLAAALCGGLSAAIWPLGVQIGTGVVLGAICGVLALFGDLSISMLKRQSGVKDSGHLFPGHGGMLDRADSLLFVLPFLYQLLIHWVR
jgi:phosphatidate cytidylyltransferase